MALLKRLKKHPAVRDLRHRALAGLLRGCCRAASRLPLGWLRGMGVCLGSAGFALLGRDRRRALDNLRLALGESVPAARRRAIARESFRNLAVTALEFSRVRVLDTPRYLDLIDYTPEQEALIRDTHARGRGVIFASAHFGNWEMLAEFGPRLGIEMSVLFKPSTNPYFTRFMTELRGKTRMIDINADLSVVVRRLREGGAVSLLFDENARGRGVELPFFGRPASTYRGPAYFCLRAGSPIICAYLVRGAGLRHRLLLERTIEPRRLGSLEEDIRRIMLEMNRSLETVVRQYPGQWYWMYRRWPRRPASPPVPDPSGG
ncbi:MAG TPA: lysophospholipid acyltransferase family protein [bacterium]|nr:lysophospholipid acyltransferase family protein [bacterium]HPQ65481.1 lysophospholipid acyltransferase family protein [bacterium]